MYFQKQWKTKTKTLLGFEFYVPTSVLFFKIQYVIVIDILLLQLKFILVTLTSLLMPITI